MAYNVFADNEAEQIKSVASNVFQGTNPDYDLADFYAVYPAYAPQGTEPSVTYLVDPDILQMYLDLANACIKQIRYHSYWAVCMGWFVAHFATLYLQGTALAGSTAAQVTSMAQARYNLASKAVGDVSASYDVNSIAADLDGWAHFKLTIYGQQLATAAKLVGKGGMYVW